ETLVDPPETACTHDFFVCRDSVEVNWVELLAKAIEQATEATTQSIKSKRTFALLEGYEKDNDSVAQSVAEGNANKVFNLK
ncbi:hypothetical protein INT47_005250, partial [Mucor saturninus]